MSSETENPIEDLMEEVTGEMGSGALRIMAGSRQCVPVEAISTGVSTLDDATGIGGFPRGRITEIFGPEASGKTTLAVQVLANALQSPDAIKSDHMVMIADLEHALDASYVEALGLDMSRTLISQPDCAEDALSIVESVIKTGKVDAIVVDSVAAMLPRAEINGEFGEYNMGLAGRLMSQAMRKLNAVNAANKCALIFINQIRDKLGVAWGSPETTTGGRALKFYASLRVDIRRTSKLESKGKIIGANTKVKIVKNKFAAPYQEVDLKLVYGKGLVNK